MITQFKHTVLAIAVIAGAATAMVSTSAATASPSRAIAGLTSPILVASPHSTSLDLTWQPLAGADRYRWKIREDGGAWSNNTQVFAAAVTIAGLQPSTTYRVAVGARIHGKWQSTWSQVTMVTDAGTAAGTDAGHDSVPDATHEQPAIDATADSTTLSVKWQPVPGAQKYRWRIRAGQDQWSSISHVEGTELTISDLNSWTTYTVAIGARVDDRWRSTWEYVTMTTGEGAGEPVGSHDTGHDDPGHDDTGNDTGADHTGHDGGSTGDWLPVADDPAVYRDSRTPATYSFFDPTAMNDPNWGLTRLGFFVECESVGFQQIDPIVSPGVRSAHLHEFFGSPVVGNNLTTQELVDVPKSKIACTDKNDKSAYWSPAVYQDGKRITATTFKAYYKSPTTDVVPIPLGLRMVAGNADATSNQSEDIGGWVGEGNKFNHVNTYGANKMIQRPDANANIALRVNYPQCWDGAHLDSPDHKSHMAYEKSNGTCPASHPVRIPQLVTFAQYDTVGGAGLSLASGDWFTFHQDFWNGWSPDQMSDLIGACITEQMMCRVRTSPNLLKLGQYVDTVPSR